MTDDNIKALIGAHTQGPWRTGGPSDGFIGNVLADNPRRLIAQVTVQDGEQTLANAQLMAAAPDLLEQLLAIKQEFADFKQKVSDAAEVYEEMGCPMAWEGFEQFIIRKPDPLVEVIKEWWNMDIRENDAETLRELLEARGLEIREKGQ